MDWDQALQHAFEIIEKEEKDKRELWRISYEIRKKFGSKGLKEFTENLKENFGISRSYNTLRQYAQIYEMTKDYDIPADVPYTTIRAIVNSQRSLDYIKMIQSGMSGIEVMRIILTEKPGVKRHAHCPRCRNILICPCEKKEENKEE